MPLANAWKLCVCLVVVLAGLIHPAMGQVPPLQNPYDPAYLAAPALIGGAFDDRGITLPLPNRFREGKALLTFEDFEHFDRNRCCYHQHFSETHWVYGPVDNRTLHSEPYKIVYEHPYFIMFVSKYKTPDGPYGTMAHILVLHLLEKHEMVRFILRSTPIGDERIFHVPTPQTLEIMRQLWFVPPLEDGYINLDTFDWGGYEIWYRQTTPTWIMKAPLRCRTENPPECARSREDCDRYPDLCGYVEEVQQKLGFTLDDPKSILPQTQRPAVE